MKRISQLDGVRGIAILLVLVWHYLACQIVTGPKRPLSYLNEALSVTWSGVDLFFVLSGFLIAGVLLDQQGSTNYFKVFYIRRACRIFPLYFLLLGVFACVSGIAFFRSPRFDWLLHSPLPLWSYATFTQNFLMAAREDFGAHWMGVTWSLAVEEQFYLVIPLLFYFLPRKRLVWVLIVAILAAPLLRCAFPGFHSLVTTPMRSDSLLTGALLAILVRWKPFLTAVEDHRGAVLAVFLMLLAGTGVMSFRPDPFGAFANFWLAALYGVFVLMAFTDSQPVLGRILQSPPLVWFGKLSYGIYMFHEAVSGLVHGFLFHEPPRIRSLMDIWATLLAFFITIGLAMLSYHFFEMPFLKLGRRFHYESPPNGPDGPGGPQ
jgi:peptidoglycan/LPS O-acetylase OafA/YrhL